MRPISRYSQKWSLITDILSSLTQNKRQPVSVLDPLPQAGHHIGTPSAPAFIPSGSGSGATYIRYLRYIFWLYVTVNIYAHSWILNCDAILADCCASRLMCVGRQSEMACIRVSSRYELTLIYLHPALLNSRIWTVEGSNLSVIKSICEFELIKRTRLVRPLHVVIIIGHIINRMLANVSSGMYWVV